MFTRLFNQIRGRISLFFSRIEEKNPEVLLENAKQDLVRIRADLQKGIVGISTISAQLKRQVAEGEHKKNDLEGRALVAYQSGHTQLAEELAAMLQEVTQDLETNKNELAQNEANLENYITMSRVQEKEAQTKLRRYSQMISKAKAKTAMADVTELLSGSVTEMTAAASNMERLETTATGALDKAEGRIRAATSTLNFQEVKVKQQEQEVAKKAALANLLASKGIKPAQSAPLPTQAAPSTATPVAPIAVPQPEAPKLS